MMRDSTVANSHASDSSSATSRRWERLGQVMARNRLSAANSRIVNRIQSVRRNSAITTLSSPGWPLIWRAWFSTSGSTRSAASFATRNSETMMAA